MYFELKFVRSSANVLNKSSAIQNQLSNTKQPKTLVLSETPIPTFNRTLLENFVLYQAPCDLFKKTAFLKLTTTTMTINHYPIPFISFLNFEFEDKIKCKKAITKTHLKPIWNIIFFILNKSYKRYVFSCGIYTYCN